MLLRYFNSNKAGLQILFLVVALFLWLQTLVNPAASFTSASDLAGPLGRVIFNRVSGIPGLAAFFGMIGVVLYGYLLVQLNAGFFFLKTRSQLPQLFYILVTGCLFTLHYLSPPMLAALLVIILIFRLFKSYKKDRLVFNFLDAGILLAVAVLIYIPAVLLLPVLLITLILFRNRVWQEWLYPWIGFFIPFLFWASYLYITDQSPAMIMDEFRRAFASSGSAYDYSLMQLIFYGYIMLLVILGSFHMIRTIGTRKVQARVIFIFFLWLFIFSIITVLTVPSTGSELFYTGGISLSFLLSNYFATCNNTRMNNFLLFLLFAGSLMVVADNWFGFIPGHYSF